MERPDINKDAIEFEGRMRLVARTQDMSEAERIAEQYGKSGFQTRIIKAVQGGVSIYEVWIGKTPDSVFARR